ncbi:MAG: carboxypeptidase regulatory-like domain-containing protein, partial [Myxococcales bacterium]|nr:carboxypeptidase regulatory-like domain-containing protein [Myxococcales bacterium]
KGFHLEMQRHEIVISGAKSGYDPRLVISDNTDIYIDSTLLSSWLGMEFEINLSQLLVKLHSEEPLPIQQRMRRQELRERVAALQERTGASLPRRTARYERLSWPFLDAELEHRERPDESSSSYSLLASADFLGMETRLYARGDDEESLESLRLRALRNDVDGGLLGPLRATSVEFGDVFAPPVELVTGGGEGLGLFLSNEPLNQAQQFAATTIRGDALPGWEIDLFRNGSLLDFTTANSSGVYEFRDVPLGFGLNVMRSVAYGPEGQVREHIERYQIGADMPPPGKLRYRIFAVRPGNFVVERDADKALDLRDAEPWDLHGGFDYGISKKFSFGGGLSRTEVAGERRDYASLVLRGSTRGFFTEVEGVRDLDGGSMLRFSGQGHLGGGSLLAQHSLFDDYESRDSTAGALRSRETLVRLGGNFVPPFLHTIGYTLDYERKSFVKSTRPREERLGFRLSTGVRGVSLSHELNLVQFGGSSDQPRRLRSLALLSGRVRGIQLRARASYDWRPEAELKDLSATASYHIRPDLKASLGISHTRSDADTDTVFRPGLSWQHPRFALGAEASLGADEGTSGQVSMSFSLGREPTRGKWLVQRKKLAASTSALARVYLDRNANDVFDEGDEPIPGAKLRGASGWDKLRTDEDGLVFLTGVPPNRPRAVRLDLTSLEDPFWVPMATGYAMLGHSGGSVQLDFPVRIAGELEGEVRSVRAGVQKPMRAIEVQLVDSERQVVKTTRSGFDGYYIFQGVLPGRYWVRVAPGAVRLASLQSPLEVDVELGADGGVLSEIDLVARDGPQAVRFAKRPVVPEEASLVSTSEPQTSATEPKLLSRMGEIAGQVRGHRAAALLAVRAAQVELVNEERRVVQTGQSASDGSFLFQGVSAGHYWVRFAPGSLRESGLHPPLEVRVEATPERISGVDLVLRDGAQPLRFAAHAAQLVEREPPAPAPRGSIAGAVRALRGEALEPMGRTPVQLVDDARQVVQTVRSGPDGRFAFRGVAPGAYWARIALGAARRTGLPPPLEVRVELSAEHREISGIELVLRKGPQPLRFGAHAARLIEREPPALTPWGEIAGAVRALRGAALEPMGQTLVQLVDDARQVVQTLRSGPDGRFAFRGVAPGAYWARIALGAARRTGLPPPLEVRVELSPEHREISGIELVLRKGPQPLRFAAHAARLI